MEYATSFPHREFNPLQFVLSRTSLEIRIAGWITRCETRSLYSLDPGCIGDRIEIPALGLFPFKISKSYIRCSPRNVLSRKDFTLQRRLTTGKSYVEDCFRIKHYLLKIEDASKEKVSLRCSNEKKRNKR